jgi:pimeloyl-ACP methyl ester carboxylesterase
MNVGIHSQRSYIDVLGVRTAYYRKGSGRTLILLHGSSPGACSDLNWFRNFEVFADSGFDVIAFDQPGFGHSDAPEDHSVEFRYRHAEALLLALRVKSAVLVGNSLGGLLAVLLDHRLDKTKIRIEGLVLAAQFPHFEISAAVREATSKHTARLANLEPTFDGVKDLTCNTFADRSYVTDDLVRLRLSMLERTYPAHVARRQAGTTFDADEVRREKVTTSTLIIWGLDDHSLPVAIGVQAMDHFSNAQFLFLPHSGHWPQTEQTRIFNRSVMGFMSDLEADPGTGAGGD